MEKIIIEDYEFLKFQCEEANFIFSTAKGNLNFNKSLEEGINNINNLKKWFNVNEVGFLNQIHSDKIYNYNGIVHTGDGIISNKRKIALGVFTADCVPVLLFDKKNKVISAVHSGWKSTIKDIVIKTLDKMKNEYNTDMKDIVAYIGPHNRECCYEIGQEVAYEFQNCSLYNNLDIIKDSKLSLEKCIIRQLESKGVLISNINTTNICTYCSGEYELHSYRRGKDSSGRMFSFIYI